MASKYEKLKGVIPVEAPTERDAAIETALKEHKGKPISELTAIYNGKIDELTGPDGLAAKMKAAGQMITALEILIREALEGVEADSVSINGYTWSEACEPYPVVKAADVDQIVDYFLANGMEEQLKLKAGELATRLKAHVKEEALNGELDVDVQMVPDPEAPGGEREVRTVHSKVPGVRVFMKASLSRVKTSKGRK